MTRVGFWTRGGDNYGFGHIARTQLLVRALRRIDSGVKMIAAIEGPDWVRAALRALDVEVHTEFPHAEIDVVVVDVLEPKAPLIQEVRRNARRIAAFSDMDTPVGGADIVIAPQTLHQLPEVGAKLLSGPTYFSISERFSACEREKRAFPKVARSLLINLGGEAHAGAAQRIANLLEQIATEWERIVWIAGWGFPAEQRACIGARFSDIQIAEFVECMPELLSVADLAFVAGGFVKWEAAYCGTPMIITALVDHQEKLGASFAGTNAARYVGRLDALCPPDLAAEIRLLQHDPALRRKMSEAGRNLIDGRGAERVARAILELAAQ